MRLSKVAHHKFMEAYIMNHSREFYQMYQYENPVMELKKVNSHRQSCQYCHSIPYIDSTSYFHPVMSTKWTMANSLNNLNSIDW